MKTFSELINEILQESKKEIPIPQAARESRVDHIVTAIMTDVNKKRSDGKVKNNDFYAGICKDVEQNMQRHCNKDYVALVDCGTREKAGEVETALAEKGFDVGKRADNGGDEDTTIVYVIKKDKNFKK